MTTIKTPPEGNLNGQGSNIINYKEHFAKVNSKVAANQNIDPQTGINDIKDINDITQAGIPDGMNVSELTEEEAMMMASNVSSQIENNRFSIVGKMTKLFDIFE
ncbi:MAG: hypothetical protein ACTSXQ_04920 [Alphaproteobacteria bacterium]